MDNRVLSFYQLGTDLLVEVSRDIPCAYWWLIFMKPDKRFSNGYRYVDHEIVPFKDGDGDPITIEDIMHRFNLVANF